MHIVQCSQGWRICNYSNLYKLVNSSQAIISKFKMLSFDTCFITNTNICLVYLVFYLSTYAFFSFLFFMPESCGHTRERNGERKHPSMGPGDTAILPPVLHGQDLGYAYAPGVFLKLESRM